MLVIFFGHSALNTVYCFSAYRRAVVHKQVLCRIRHFLRSCGDTFVKNTGKTHAVKVYVEHEYRLPRRCAQFFCKIRQSVITSSGTARAALVRVKRNNFHAHVVSPWFTSRYSRLSFRRRRLRRYLRLTRRPQAARRLNSSFFPVLLFLQLRIWNVLHRSCRTVAFCCCGPRC